ncbi:MAG: PP2C family protein-serine/threonine phosphatase [Coprococcus sp.]
MGLILTAACTCHMGHIRKNNEDNLYFDGRILPRGNTGLKNIYTVQAALNKSPCFGVFDGMGGEAHGEEASFLAAYQMQQKVKALEDYLYRPSTFFEELIQEMNTAVCNEASRLQAGRMGSTAVMLYFEENTVYQCNVGDSRAYRLRDNAFLQLSENHTDELFLKAQGIHRKPSLTQHLGIWPEEMLLEPHIVKCGIQEGDCYLLCSDGLTDMLSNAEICDALLKYENVGNTVQQLQNMALERGGRDNVTIIVIRIDNKKEQKCGVRDQYDEYVAGMAE